MGRPPGGYRPGLVPDSNSGYVRAGAGVGFTDLIVELPGLAIDAPVLNLSVIICCPDNNTIFQDVDAAAVGRAPG